MNFIQKILRLVRLFQKAFRGYGARILLLAGIGFFGGLLEGIGVNALIPLFSFAVGGGTAEDPISKMIKYAFDYLHIDFAITALLIFIAVLFVTKAIVLFVGAYITFKINFNFEKDFRTSLFKKLLYSRWEHLLKQRVGHSEKVLSVEIKNVARLLTTLSSSILVFSSLVVFLFVAINISVSITLLTLVTGFAVAALFHPIVRRLRITSQDVASQLREVAHFINESVLGLKTIKSISVSEAVAARGELYFESLRAIQIKRSVLSNVFGAFFQPFSVIFVLLLFAFAYKTSSFNFPAFVAIVYLIQRMFSQIQDLQAQTQNIFNMLPYMEHVLSYQKQILKNEEEKGGGRSFVFANDFVFEQVSFAYEGGEDVLKDVSFRIKKGAFMGLIGSSGAGKTTIVDLMLRLFTPDSGRIFLDGVSASLIDVGDWRKKIGYVSQDIHLINDTIENNIRFFDDTIAKKEIVRAAKQANIFDFIDALPEKFSTIVGERGIQLSAGQRQRVVIARVLARNPQLLILDEATSALDNESEKRIQEVIALLKGNVTVFAIAHRLGTVLDCDELIVLDGGKIVETGSPRELLKDKETYFYKAYNIRT